MAGTRRRRSSCLNLSTPPISTKLGSKMAPKGNAKGTTILSLPDRDHVSGLCRANPCQNTAKDAQACYPMCPAHRPNPWEWERRQADIGRHKLVWFTISRMMTNLSFIILGGPGDAKWMGVMDGMEAPLLNCCSTA